MNRPQVKNAYDLDLLRALDAALGRAEQDAATRVVVVRGRGDSFCAGADVSMLDGELAWSDLAQAVSRVFKRIASSRRVTIAAVHGWTIAGGFELMLACDLAVAAEESRIGDFHIRIGLFAGAGTIYRLPRLIGLRKARELMLSGDVLDGRQAKEWNLVNNVAPLAELDALVERFAAKFADKSPTIAWLTRRHSGCSSAWRATSSAKPPTHAKESLRSATGGLRTGHRHTQGSMARRAVVTGGAGAIGAAITRLLAEDGMRVAVCARSLEAARSVSEASEAFAADLADTASIEAMAAEIGAAGPVDVCWGDVQPFFETSPATWDTLLAVNLRAVIQLSHEFVPEMAERGWGRIVFVGSDAGRVGSRNEAVYAAAKGGVNAFCKSLAHEVARRGVTCNVVSPGPTETPRLAAYRAEHPEKITPLLRRIPIGRVGTPDDVAAAAAFLCSDQAAYITGQVLSVNGGLHMP